MAKMNPMYPVHTTRLPSPAIVAQEAVRRFPRWALVLLCAVYIGAGFIGREPWKSADLAGFGSLQNVLGASDWTWLVARMGAMSLISLTMLCTWYSTYYLARRDAAQPVPFAFGGEAKPTAYAMALADGALLALVACLGLAQLAHETTTALLQMALFALVFFGLSCFQYHPIKSALALLVGVLGIYFTTRGLVWDSRGWQSERSWLESGHMLVWFAWPAWALAVLALYKWRGHWLSARPALHIALPAIFVLLFLTFLPAIDQKDRWFLGALPSLCVLAAFALPTIKRGMKSLVDLFTLIFFCGCALIIWVVWIAMQTGIPPQPAANVARLLPAFVPTFSAPVFLLALAATLAWGWLVYWRVGKHRPALWMSMVLPASGATLCWMLLTTLWLPLLDHARSYRPLLTLVEAQIPAQTESKDNCVATHGLGAAQQAALRYYLKRTLETADRDVSCRWLIVDGGNAVSLAEFVALPDWQLQVTIRRPSDKGEDWLIYRRKPDVKN